MSVKVIPEIEALDTVMFMGRAFIVDSIHYTAQLDSGEVAPDTEAGICLISPKQYQDRKERIEARRLKGIERANTPWYKRVFS